MSPAALRRTLWVNGVLALVLVLVANHLAAAVPLRWDLTASGRHTLSDVARDSVQGLRRPLVARVFFSDDLAAPFHDHRRALLDLLRELRAHSGEKLYISAVDPAGDPEATERAAALGVRPLPYAYRAADRTEARTVYMGVAFEYGDQVVAAEALPDVSTMELQVVRAIRRVTTERQDVRSVGWLLGHGEPDPTVAAVGTPLRTLAERLAASGRFRTVAPGDAPIPDDLDVLLLVAPQRPLSDEQIAQLDAFLARGGAVMAWLSSVRPDFEGGRILPVDHGLYAWLGHHGIRVNRDVLLDRDHCEPMVVPMDLEGRGRQLVQVTYPLALTTTALDRARATLRDVPRLLLPFASSLQLRDTGASTEAAIWATTMPGAAQVRTLDTLDPKALRAPLPGEQVAEVPVVAAMWGRFTPQSAEGPRLGRPSRLVVVSSGDAVANNLDFALNAVDWLADDPALIEIRSRAVVRPPLSRPSSPVMVKVAMMGVPLLVVMLLAAVAGRRP
ncbi:MAG: GldG family protein [Myxococcales bacterium]|nr:GldG family protein [Myxococcales bacterium]